MNISTPTLPAFKRWAKDTAPAARAVLMARAHAQLQRERVDAYVKPIFDSYRFTYSNKYPEKAGQPLASPKHLYLADDEPMVAAFFADCDKAHREHGFTGPAGHCPALTAEHLLVVAENWLIELAEPLFGIESCQLDSDERAKYLDLLIGACIKADPAGARRAVANAGRI